MMIVIILEIKIRYQKGDMANMARIYQISCKKVGLERNIWDGILGILTAASS